MRKVVFCGVLLGLIFFSFNVVLADVQVVSGNITENTTWSGEILLRGAVFVKAPATLTIEPGTIIYGEQATIGTLIIERGAKIHAEGTLQAPIVFTSELTAIDPGSRARGDWGGLIINGYAPINVPGGEAIGEGDTGVYGGNDPHDNSGILRYVRVEYAGHEFSPENELNGIAFQGVGDGTTVDHVQVHMNLDDGIEMFGGTVNFKYALTTNIGDDNFDWTDGWQGKAQFLVCQQRADDADNGIEADNNAENNNYTPRSNPTIYNITLIGDPDFSEGEESDLGMLLREGTAGRIYNAIVVGFKDPGLDIDHTATFEQADARTLVMGNSIFWNNGSNQGGQNFSKATFDDDPAAPYAATWGLQEVDPKILNPYELVNPDFRPGSDSPAVDGTIPVATPPDDGFFESVNFIGGVDPNNDWTKGWTTFPLFSDISSSHWAFEYVKNLRDLGWTTGYPDGTYGPENSVSRAEMAAFLIRAKIGDDFTYEETPHFPDISSDHWAFKYIQKLYELGITTGYPDGTYGPYNNVTRAEMAAFLIRAFVS